MSPAFTLPTVQDADLTEVYAFPESNASWVRANFVCSLDGAATMDGRSGGLGNESDRRIFGLLRGLADVVLVGAGTARAESYGPVEADPVWGGCRQGRPDTPSVAVVSRSLDLDPAAPLFAEAPSHARTIVLTCSEAPENRRRQLSSVADVVVVGAGRVEPELAVTALSERGLRRVSCEGGPHLLADLTAADCLDELCLTLSPVLVAGGSPRIANGPQLPHTLSMSLVSMLQDEAFLFLRYTKVREQSGAVDPSAIGGA